MLFRSQWSGGFTKGFLDLGFIAVDLAEFVANGGNGF